MRLHINGQATELPETTDITHAIATITDQTATTGIAVAVNGEVVPRGNWHHHHLGDGDHIEILTASQGG